jgi:GNAT superfamily N-acetyltransferase
MSGLTIEKARGERALAEYAAVRNAVDPVMPVTVDEMLQLEQHEPERVSLLARRDGRAVGVAMAQPLFGQHEAAWGFVHVRVLPDARRQGTGGALFDAAAEHLRSLGKREAQSWVAIDSADGLAFVERRGLREIGRNQHVALDLTGFEPSGAVLPPGVELTDLAARPDLLRGVWTCDLEATRDIPGPDGDFDTPFDSYAQMLAKPAVEHRLVLLAVADGEVVGVAKLLRSLGDPQQAEHWMTGVRRAWRGRGIARALKEHQLVRARALGVRVVRTSNELRNEPIRRLNQQLGYLPEPEHVMVRGALEGRRAR